MRYYKSFGDVLKSEFSRAGLKDDSGIPIRPGEKGMNEKEHTKYRKDELNQKINNLKIKRKKGRSR